MAREFTSAQIEVDLVYVEHHGRAVGVPAAAVLHPLRGRTRHSFLQIARFMKVEKPDVVICVGFMMSVAGLVGSYLSRYRGVMLINEVGFPDAEGARDYAHIMPFRAVVAIYNRLYPAADAIVCVSHAAKTAFEQLAISDRVRHRLTVIPNPASLSGPSGGPSEPLSHRSGEPSFVVLGRLVQLKRVDLAIEGFFHFLQQSGVGNLYIAGEGEKGPELRRLVGELGIDDRVHFMGYVPNPVSLLTDATALLHLARSDACPLAVAEAMSLGTPAIVVRGSGGPEEMIGAGGMAVEPAPVAVSAAMEELWARGERGVAAEEAAKQAAEPYAPNRVAGAWIQLINDLLDSKGSATSGGRKSPTT